MKVCSFAQHSEKTLILFESGTGKSVFFFFFFLSFFFSLPSLDPSLSCPLLFRWKTPFSSHPELLMRSLSITHPNAEKTIENLNILCSREIKWEGKEGKKEGEEKGKGEEEKEEGVENKGKGGKKEKTRKERKEGREKDRGYGRFFVLVSRVKQKGIQFLKDKKQASPIQVFFFSPLSKLFPPFSLLIFSLSSLSLSLSIFISISLSLRTSSPLSPQNPPFAPPTPPPTALPPPQSL